MRVFMPRSATQPADSASPVRVLVVEANAEDARALGTALGDAKRAAFEATTAVSLADALERLSRDTFQVVLLSLPLPDSSGSAALQAIGQQFPALPIIVITHVNDESAALEMLRSGAEDYLVKGQVNASVVERVLLYGIERKRLTADLARERNLFQSLALNIPDTAWTLDADWRFAFISPNIERLSGYSADEITQHGAVFFLSIHPDDVGKVKGALEALFATGQAYAVEYRTRRKSGGWVWVYDRAVSTYERNGVRYADGLLSDITERKRAEEALRLRTEAIEAAANGIMITDKEGAIVSVNAAVTTQTGYSGAELLGKNPRILKSDRQDEAFYREMWTAIRSGKVWRGEMMNRRKDGSLCAEEMTITPVRDQAGAITHFIAIKQDVTERKQAEAALAAERHLLRSLMAGIPDPIYFKDLQHRYVRINDALARLMGVRRPEEVEGHTAFDYDQFSPEAARQFHEDEREIIQSGQPQVGHIDRICYKDGSVRWYSATRLPLRSPSGRVVGTFGVSRDITDLKHAEAALRKSQEQLRLLLDSTAEAICAIDLEGNCTLANPACLRLLGYDSADVLIGRNMHALIHHTRADGKPYPAGECLVRQALQNGKEAHVDDEVLWRADGTSFPAEYWAHPVAREGKMVGAVVTFLDITDRERLEVELRHAQKLEAVGRLAAGVAHEINTPIQFVGDNTRFLQEAFRGVEGLLLKYEEFRRAAGEKVEPGLVEELAQAEEQADWEYLKTEVPKALEQTLDGVNRVAQIVRAMKEFSHVNRSAEKLAADLNKALESTLVVARNELKYVAEVETEFGEIPPVVCHLGDLNQVFLNLLINAAHAIGDVVKGTEGKGKIGVRTWREGEQVVVAVSDTGTGIPAEIQEKVFEPFFTTKEVGKGTGQGLTLARSVVVDRHGGSLTFESGMGKGTTFFVRVPIHAEKAEVEEGVTV